MRTKNAAPEINRAVFLSYRPFCFYPNLKIGLSVNNAAVAYSKITLKKDGVEQDIHGFR